MARTHSSNAARSSTVRSSSCLSRAELWTITVGFLPPVTLTLPADIQAGRLDLCTTHLWSYPGGTIPMQVFSNPLLAPLYRSMKTESSVFSS